MSQPPLRDAYKVILADGTLSEGAPRLSEPTLKRIYRLMLLTRILDSKALNLQRQGRIGFYVQCAGQEAAQVGSAFVAKEEDWLLPTYRDMGVAVARGVPLPTLFGHLKGNSDDPMQGRQMPNHWGFKGFNFVSIASTIAAHLPVAVGIGMAMKMKNEAKAVLAYHGDGATSAGDFHTAYNFAGVFKAPVVFICENNGWAISLPVSSQTASRTLSEKARAYGFDGIRVDGNDVLAVMKATRDSMEKARRGEGPTMMECLTYRMGAHSSSDDPSKYRTNQEIENWKKKDPIERFRIHLENIGIWSKDYEESLRSEIEMEIAEAIGEEEKVPRPNIESLFTDVYSEIPWHIKEQLGNETTVSS